MSGGSNIKAVKKAFLCYPPIGLFQRGEERCQADIEGSATQAPHAPNDLGYLASVLGALGVEPVIKDYPAQRAKERDVYGDITSFNPDMIIISTTNPTFFEDMEFLRKVKSLLPDIITVAKGGCFFSVPLDEMEKEAFKYLDIAVYGEAEFIIKDVVDSLRNGVSLENINGLIIGIGTKNVKRTSPPDFNEDLDALPFPRRDLIKNGLYKNPVTGRPMATIVVSRGCPARCIFCLTPLISGRKLRKRSVQNVIDELKECAGKHGIKDFFFRADTFTLDKNYVKDLCKEIKKNDLDIAWVANSRTDVADAEMLNIMRAAGCWLMAFGVESGNDDIQKKIKKGADSAQARNSIKLCRQTGIKTLGFFMIGFPWDTDETLADTYNLMRELDCDFIEVHIAMPFDGTELNSICRQAGLIKDTPMGYNYFSNPYIAGTLQLTRGQLIEFRKKMIRGHYLRFSYIFRTLKGCRSIKECFNYFKYGLRLLDNILRTAR
jgi:anaerobic magnesium-protoporphyrin IX monomethyl ester cyclase